MARISGEKRKRKTEEKVDLNTPLPSPGASINPSSDWWANFSRRFSGYPPDSLFKVSRKTFEYICGLVEEEMMTGQNCTDLGRKYLMLNDRVAIALTRLSTGESLDAVSNLFKVSISTVSLITWRFVEAIEKKGFHHLHWPKTEEQVMEIKSKFERIRGLPNCCGAIDTTNIVFCLSSDHPSSKIWRDSENNASMILLAVVDPDMRFLDIIAGLPGSLSEPDVLCEWSLFNLCEEGKRLNGKKLKLAENKEEIREYLVGNGGFPLLPWLLTPYNQEKKLCDVKEDFNKRHYKTWKVAKMAFERLKETWQIIQGMLWTPDKHKLPRIIYACCVLHNILIDQNDGIIMQDQSFLQSDDNSPQVHKQKCKFRDKTASVQRDNLALYLSAKLPPFSSKVSKFSNLGKMKKLLALSATKQAAPRSGEGGSNQPSRSRKSTSQSIATLQTMGQVLASMRDEDDDAIVDVDVETSKEVEDRPRKRHVETDPAQEMENERPFKWLNQTEPVGTVKGLPNFDTNQLANLDNKALSTSLRKAQRLVNFFTRESIKRLAAPIESLDDLKKKIQTLENDMITKSSSYTTLENQYDSLAKELKDAKTAKEKLSKSLSARVAELAEKSKQLLDLELDLGSLNAQNDDLQKQVDAYPSKLDIERKEAIASYRQSAELVEDLGLIMGAAMRGGFTSAIDKVKKLYPDLKVESIDDEESYDPNAADTYDLFMEDFRAGTSLSSKYANSVEPTTDAVHAETDPVTASTANPTPASADATTSATPS